MNWLKMHERLIIWIGVILLVLFLGNKVINYQIAHDQMQFGAAKAQVEADAKKNLENAQRIMELSTQAAEQTKALEEKARQLNKAIEARDVKAKEQEKWIISLNDAALAANLGSLLPSRHADVRVSTSPGEFDLTRPTLVEVEQTLTEVPKLRSDLADVREIVNGKDEEIVTKTNLIDSLKNQTAGLGRQITDGDLACKAQIATIKSEARRSKKNWFIAGVIAASVALRVVLR